MEGMRASRSGLFWEWLRVIDEMASLPKVICLENVVGLVSSQKGSQYQVLHEALVERGYRVGPMMLDAIHWLPQSRRRIFIVAIQKGFETSSLETQAPNWTHSAGVLNASADLEQLVWWKLPRPTGPVQRLSDLIDWKAPCFEEAKAAALIDLVPERHRALMLQQAAVAKRAVFPGYRRTRSGKQVLELRFDDISGCLRTAEGGSSRQFLILARNGKLAARLLTPREAASLMGAPETYRLSENYNASYSAMGDAVAVPVVRHLAEHLLAPLVQTAKSKDDPRRKAPAFCLQP
jgi:DNA (cytosine-5)-methyltransferase 1